jgi:hypothetical protein
MKSWRIPYWRSFLALPSPMTANRIPARARISWSDKNQSIKMRTPVGEVKTIQSILPALVHGSHDPSRSFLKHSSRTGSGFIGTVSIEGISRTSAPIFRKRPAIPEINSLGRVSRIFFPPKGSFSTQAKVSARRQTSPTTMIAGALICARPDSSSSEATVARTRLCPAVVPLSRTAAGVSGRIPASRSPRIMTGSVDKPIRKINVPLVRTSAS